jgi:hypothetical protein
MNLSTHTDRNVNASAKVVSFSAARRIYRERSFGVGYGSSSGYALDKRYTTDWGQIRFRCA